MKRAFAALLFLAGCGAEPLQAPAPGVVATIGDEQVRSDELRDYAERVPITLLSATKGDSARQQYLRSLLVRRLLSREVAERGLDTSRTVTTRAANAVRKKLADLYRQEQIWPRVSVSRDRVVAFYDSLGLDLRRKVAGIVTPTAEEAQQLRRALLAGENFEKLAARHSKHPLSAASGGDIGFVTARQAAKLGISGDLYAQLPDSVISDVLPLGDSYQIIRFLETRRSPVEDFAEQIIGVLMNQERGRVEAQVEDSLATEFGWRYVPEAIGILNQRGGGGAVIQPWLLTATEMSTPLFVYADTAITVGQSLEFARAQRREITDGASAAQLVEATLRRELLYEAAARNLKMHERADVMAWVETLIEELAITELRRQVLTADPALTDADVRAVYDDYPDLFRESDDVLIVETFVATRQDAEAVLQAVEAGESFLDVARRTTLRTGGPEAARGTLRLNQHERMTNSVLYAAVQEAPLDKIVGPVEVPDGFSLFRIIQREKGALKPFLDVEARASAFARRFKQNSAFERFVDGLFDQYDEQLSVYDTELVLALPDSLIDEISRRDHARAGLPVSLN